MKASFFTASSLVLVEQASATLPACTVDNKGTILYKQGGGFAACDGLLPAFLFLSVVWFVGGNGLGGFSSSPPPSPLNSSSLLPHILIFPRKLRSHPSPLSFLLYSLSKRKDPWIAIDSSVKAASYTGTLPTCDAASTAKIVFHTDVEGFKGCNGYLFCAA